MHNLFSIRYLRGRMSDQKIRNARYENFENFVKTAYIIMVIGEGTKSNCYKIKIIFLVSLKNE